MPLLTTPAAEKNSHLVPQPIYYTGKSQDELQVFQESTYFSQFKEEYTTTLHSLGQYLPEREGREAFNVFLSRVFLPDTDSDDEKTSNQFYLLKSYFEKILMAVELAEARLNKGKTPEENQRLQANFKARVALLNDFSRALKTASADELFTCVSDAAFELGTQEHSYYTGKSSADAQKFQQSKEFAAFREEYTSTVNALREMIIADALNKIEQEKQNKKTEEQDEGEKQKIEIDMEKKKESERRKTHEAFDKFLQRIFPDGERELITSMQQLDSVSLGQFYVLKRFFEKALHTVKHAQARLKQGETPEENQQRQDILDFKMGVLDGLLNSLREDCADGLITYSSEADLLLDADGSTLWNRVKTWAGGVADEIIGRQMAKDRTNNVHVAWSFREALDLPVSGKDVHRVTVPPGRIEEVREALKNGLTANKMLAKFQLELEEYRSSLADFPPDKIDEPRLRKKEVKRRGNLAAKEKERLDRQLHNKMKAGAEESAFSGLSTRELYQLDIDKKNEYSILLLNKHPDALLRLEKAFVQANAKHSAEIRKAGGWGPLNWGEETKVAEDPDGTVWRISDFFWRESPQGEISQLKLHELHRWIEHIGARQRFAIIDRATPRHARSLSQLDPKYLPEDAQRIAAFLSKMVADRVGVDYVTRHAVWFEKILVNLDVNPLAESMLRLPPKKLAALPFWMFGRMNDEQQDKLIRLLSPIWFPDNSGRASLITLIDLPVEIQNKVAEQIARCLQAAANQAQFNALTFAELLKISPQILQRADMADILAAYFNAYARAGADIETALLLRLPEFPDDVIRILLKEMPPHRIFTAEVSDQLAGHFSRMNIDYQGAVHAYLEAHADYFPQVGLEGIAELSPFLLKVSTPQLSAYINANIPAVSASLLADITEPGRNNALYSALIMHGHELPVLKKIAVLTADTWQRVLLEIPPDKLYRYFANYPTGSLGTWHRFESILREKGGEDAPYRYLKSYLDAHPDYMREVGLSDLNNFSSQFLENLFVCADLEQMLTTGFFKKIISKLFGMPHSVIYNSDVMRKACQILVDRPDIFMNALDRISLLNFFGKISLEGVCSDPDLRRDLKAVLLSEQIFNHIESFKRPPGLINFGALDEFISIYAALSGYLRQTLGINDSELEGFFERRIASHPGYSSERCLRIFVIGRHRYLLDKVPHAHLKLLHNRLVDFTKTNREEAFNLIGAEAFLNLPEEVLRAVEEELLSHLKNNPDYFAAIDATTLSRRLPSQVFNQVLRHFFANPSPLGQKAVPHRGIPVDDWFLPSESQLPVRQGKVGTRYSKQLVVQLENSIVVMLAAMGLAEKHDHAEIHTVWALMDEQGNRLVVERDKTGQLVKLSREDSDKRLAEYDLVEGGSRTYLVGDINRRPEELLKNLGKEDLGDLNLVGRAIKGMKDLWNRTPGALARVLRRQGIRMKTVVVRILSAFSTVAGRGKSVRIDARDYKPNKAVLYWGEGKIVSRSRQKLIRASLTPP